MTKRDSRTDVERFRFLKSFGQGEPSGVPIRRRTFLQFTGLTAGAVFLPFLEGCEENGLSLEGPGFAADYTLHLLRRDDLVVLRFDFSGLKLSDDGTMLVRFGSASPRMVVTHPAQHLLERALDESYRRYLEAGLVEKFKLDGCPILFDLIGKKKMPRPDFLPPQH